MSNARDVARQEAQTSQTDVCAACAVAFDMDGLMFETESVYWKSADVLLRRRGFAYTQALAEMTMGRTPEYCFRLFIDHFSLSEDWRTLQRESEEIFLELLEQGYDEQPGLWELLDALDARRLPYGVCTSSARRIALRVLAKNGACERLSFLITSDDITRGKPDPEIYLKAAERFAISPSDMLVLEDSVAGCRSARDAGALCVMLRAPHNVNVDFSRANAVVERLDDPAVLRLLRA